MQKVIFFFNDRFPALKERKRLKIFIKEMFVSENKKLESLSIIFCSDQFLYNINQTFLNHKYYTDVITFNLSENKYISGEVYISIDRVIENAITEAVSFEEELHRVIFHGVLHLCGYKDKQKKEIIEMRKAEKKYLSQYLN